MGICDGRTVIITGAGGGLGRAYALAFAAEGANVVINDIRAEAAQAVAAEVTAAGGRSLANSGDITTLEGAQGIVTAALAASAKCTCSSTTPACCAIACSCRSARTIGTP